MEQLEKLYHQLKGAGNILNVVEREAHKKLVEFVKAYGALDINPDGVPHTVTSLSGDEAKQYQIVQLKYNPDEDGLIATTIDGEELTYFALDDIAYLIEDLPEECLEYAETADTGEEFNYIMVNVPGVYGYSFMVKTKDKNISDSDVIDACVKQELFQAEWDFRYASINREVSIDDIEHFKNCTYNID